MATLPPLQAQPAVITLSDSTVIDAFADVRGGIIDTYNDTVQEYKGRKLLPHYVQKAEGYTIINRRL